MRLGDLKAEMQSFIMYNNGVLKRAKESAPFRGQLKVELFVNSFMFDVQNFDVVLSTPEVSNVTAV